MSKETDISRLSETTDSKSASNSEETCLGLSETEKCLVNLLDTTLVCALGDRPRQDGSQDMGLALSSQQANLTDGNSFEEGAASMSEVGY